MPGIKHLLEVTPAPAYAVDDHGVVVFANDALCEWISLKRESVIGRRVEYHSELAAHPGAEPLTDLCPPPGDPPAHQGTLSTMSPDGKLRHRRARFLWLPAEEAVQRRAMIAVVDSRDLAPQELAATLSDEPTADELHRHIRQFRRTHEEPAAAALLLGDSPMAGRLRKQFNLAVRSDAGVVVYGGCAADTTALARAVHYAKQDNQATLLPVDCRRLGQDEVLRIVESALDTTAANTSLLLQELHAACEEIQTSVATQLTQAREAPRILATVDPACEQSLTPTILAWLGPVRIDALPLADRLADLPAIVQFYVERANASAERQLSSATPEAIDQLAVYNWPHGIGQLGEVVTQACSTCQAPQLSPANLPPMVRQAVLAAGLDPVKAKPIVLDELLTRIERETVQRALRESNDNKAEAARLLGLTRQRLYRRLENLGLLSSEPTKENADKIAEKNTEETSNE